MPGLFDNANSSPNLLSLLGAQFAPNAYNAAQGQQAQTATYNALRQAIGDQLPADKAHALAAAAAMNPKEFGQFAAPYLDTAAKFLQTTNPVTGDPQMFEQRNQGGHIQVNPIQVGGEAGAPGTPTPAGSLPGGWASLSNSLEEGKAKGENSEALLNRLPSSIRDYLRSIGEGRDVPTKLSFRGVNRDNVLKLGQMIWPGLDPLTIEARKAYQHSYMNPARAALGGQLNSLGKVLNHLELVTGNALDMNNVDAKEGAPGTIGFGDIPGSAAIAHGLNAIGNSKGKNAERAAAIEGGGQIYGGELENYLTQGKGTGAERSKFAGAFSKNNLPSEFAGTAAEHLGLIKGQQQRLEEERNQKMGGFEGKYPITSPHMQEQMAKIEANIAKLRGNPVGTNPALATPSGRPPLSSFFK